MKSLIFIALYLANGSDIPNEFGLPECEETVKTGVWWPDVGCAEGAYELKSKELLLVWGNFISENPDQEKRRLTQDQLNWILWRDRACAELYGEIDEPDFRNYRTLACLIGLTSERIEYLNKNRGI
jgi:uncharacterized protein YecT (DUF1311 family)